jgi:hypothetical protein
MDAERKHSCVWQLRCGFRAPVERHKNRSMGEMQRIKSVLRAAASLLPVARMEQLYSHSLYGHIYSGQIRSALLFDDRPSLWRDLSDRVGPAAQILYLEFGVYAGDSMRAWSQLNRNTQSRLIGFDTFEGLPEAWAGLEKGHFDLGGRPPPQ